MHLAPSQASGQVLSGVSNAGCSAVQGSLNVTRAASQNLEGFSPRVTRGLSFGRDACGGGSPFGRIAVRRPSAVSAGARSAGKRVSIMAEEAAAQAAALASSGIGVGVPPIIGPATSPPPITPPAASLSRWRLLNSPDTDVQMFV